MKPTTHATWRRGDTKRVRGAQVRSAAATVVSNLCAQDKRMAVATICDHLPGEPRRGDP